MAKAVDLRKGTTILMKGDLCVVLEFKHLTPGKGHAFVQAVLRSVRTGRSFNYKFRSTEDVETARLEDRKMQFLYREPGIAHFMNLDDYSQIEIPDEIVGPAIDFLQEGSEATVKTFDGAPVEVELTPSVVLKVTETEPAVKGDSVTNIKKQATLETGYNIQVPLFVKEGDLIKVDTRSGEYIGRA